MLNAQGHALQSLAIQANRQFPDSIRGPSGFDGSKWYFKQLIQVSMKQPIIEHYEDLLKFWFSSINDDNSLLCKVSNKLLAPVSHGAQNVNCNDSEMMCARLSLPQVWAHKPNLMIVLSRSSFKLVYQ
jgi:hypothetical protein